MSIPFSEEDVKGECEPARRLDGKLMYVIDTGYCATTRNGKTVAAHRLAWMSVHGPIPEGMHIHHICRTRNCVNVDHLQMISAEDHGRLHNGLSEECKRCGANEWGYPPGGRPKRYCKPCNSKREKDYRRRNPEWAREKARKWSKNNREKCNEMQRRYRARKKAEKNVDTV